MTSWLVATLSSGRQKVADENLRDQGFVAYFPKFLEKPHSSPRNLFGRYFFVGFEKTWSAIANTRGISKIIGMIASSEIDSLKSRERNGLIILDEKPRFSKGQKVHIVGGAFSNRAGLYEGMSDSERELILIEMMGRRCCVQVEAEYLTPA